MSCRPGYWEHRVKAVSSLRQYIVWLGRGTWLLNTVESCYRYMDTIF